VSPEEIASVAPSRTPAPSIEPEEDPTPMAPPTVPLEVEAEEYAVYAALIRQNPIGYDMGSFVVIREQTAFGADDMFESAVKENADLPPGLAEGYRARNAEPSALGPELDLELDYVLMPQDEFDRILGQSGQFWPRFEETYPGASGVVTFSRVAFAAERDTALALMGFRCGDLCGAGGLYLLVKEGGEWKVQGALYGWMS
jgi:hypothetical protein